VSEMAILRQLYELRALLNAVQLWIVLRFVAARTNIVASDGSWLSPSNIALTGIIPLLHCASRNIFGCA